MSTVLEERVSTLEQLMGDLAYAQLRTERSLDRLSEEMREFKQEMGEFKDEIHSEMREFKAEMNRRWGELANRLGTLVEDVVAPNIPGILRRYFGVDEPDDLMIRRRKRHPHDRSRKREFDVIAVSGKRVFVNETKSRLRGEDVVGFAETYGELVEFYPEYGDHSLIPIVSSLDIEPDLVALCTRNGIYAMRMSDDSMDLANFEDVSRSSGAE
jgi:hypothetical protein